tara:strand:+ start:871 stop:1845 length:975 start_codon:yes stop_codon:yes gene_type:complete
MRQLDRAFDVLELLSNEEYRSGENLAAKLGVSRVAIWRQIERLKKIGVDISSVSGQGYRMQNDFETLNPAKICENLESGIDLDESSIRVTKVVDSTNAVLMRLPPSREQQVLFSEYQTAGKGRREDEWISPPGGGLWFSLSRCFENPPSSFSALGLVVGISVISGLQKLGIKGLQLKWPNDVVFEGAKLAGILIELRSEVSGPSFAVIGVGLNTSLGLTARRRINKKVVDVEQLSKKPLSRNSVASVLLSSLDENLRAFEESGFKSFHDRWKNFDFLFGKELKILCGSRVETGLAAGVDEIGALLLQRAGEVKQILSGHIIELV